MPAVVVEKVRIPFVQRASVVLRGHARVAFLVDLGLDGVFVETAETLRPGDSVALRFRLPGNSIAIECRGRVAWMNAADAPGGRPAGVGVQFVDMAPGDRARLRVHLEDYCRRQGRARRFARPWPVAAEQGEVGREDDRRRRQGT